MSHNFKQKYFHFKLFDYSANPRAKEKIIPSILFDANPVNEVTFNPTNKQIQYLKNWLWSYAIADTRDMRSINLVIPVLVRCTYTQSVWSMNNGAVITDNFTDVSLSLFLQLLRESPNLWCPGWRTGSRWFQGSTSGTVTRTASYLSAKLKGRTLVFMRLPSK